MRYLHAATVVFLVSSAAWAHPEGAPEESTGAPGEQTCVACHGGTANSGPGKVTIDAGGATYRPGAKMRLKVIIEDSAQSRWGFELTARTEADASVTAGTLATSDSNTQVLKIGGREWITHTLAGTRRGSASPVTFEFDWTAPAEGGVVLYAAANAANNNNASSGDRIYTTSLKLAAGGSGGGGTRAVFSADAVKDIWTGKGGVSPGAWITISGTELAPREAYGSPAAGDALATTLAGVTVKVNNVAAPLSYVSAEKITFLTPAATPEGDVPVVIERDGTASDRVVVKSAAALPAVHALRADGDKFYASVTTAGAGAILSLVSPKGWLLSKPEADPRAVRGAYPGEEIDIYATGLGRTEPDFVTARLLSGPANTASMPVVRIGGTAVTPTMSAMVAPGLYLVRVKVPESAAPGDVSLALEQGGVASASGVFLFVQAK